MNYAFTITEAAAFAGMEAQSVHTEIEHQVLVPQTDPRGERRLPFAAVVYLHVVREFCRNPHELAPAFRTDLFRSLSQALSQKPPPAEVPLRKYFTVRIGDLSTSIETRSQRFVAWRKKLVENDAIKGGEPVFPNSRLSVRHVGHLLLRPDATEAQQELEEDYPFLTHEDFEFAPLFVQAYPHVHSRSVS